MRTEITREELERATGTINRINGYYQSKVVG